MHTALGATHGERVGPCCRRRPCMRRATGGVRLKPVKTLPNTCLSSEYGIGCGLRRLLPVPPLRAASASGAPRHNEELTKHTQNLFSRLAWNACAVVCGERRRRSEPGWQPWLRNLLCQIHTTCPPPGKQNARVSVGGGWRECGRRSEAEGQRVAARARVATQRQAQPHDARRVRGRGAAQHARPHRLRRHLSARLVLLSWAELFQPYNTSTLQP